MTLYDGVRFISSWRWQHLQGRMTKQARSEDSMRVTHPSFRVLALATPPKVTLGEGDMEWHEGWYPDTRNEEILEGNNFQALKKQVDQFLGDEKVQLVS